MVTHVFYHTKILLKIASNYEFYLVFYCLIQYLLLFIFRRIIHISNWNFLSLVLKYFKSITNNKTTGTVILLSMGNQVTNFLFLLNFHNIFHFLYIYLVSSNAVSIEHNMKYISLYIIKSLIKTAQIKSNETKFN